MSISALKTATACHLRLAHANDESFILNSYVNSYANYQLKYGHYFALNGDVFKRAIHQQISITIPHRDVVVACSTEDPEIAAGYVIGKDLGHSILLDYCYVKDHLRKLGIAKQLLADLGVTPEKPLLYTHQTQKVECLIKHQKGLVSYVPPGSFTLMHELSKHEREQHGQSPKH